MVNKIIGLIIKFLGWIGKADPILTIYKQKKNLNLQFNLTYQTVTIYFVWEITNLIMQWSFLKYYPKPH